MSDVHPSPTLPPWVKKRDGRVVPFDPDVISLDLFAAAEAVGKPDPFLTRELTDGVLHFLAADCSENSPGTEWIADLVVKVVRELRQPQLAQAFCERACLTGSAAAPRRSIPDTPASVARRGVAAYALETVFSRDIAAAHRAGLLDLGGLESPRELAAGVLTPPEPSTTLQALQLLDAVLEARGGIASWLAFDGAEYLDLEKGSPPLPRLLTPVLHNSGLTARLHLNVAEPPAWSTHAVQGPLFTESGGRARVNVLEAAIGIVQAVLALQRERCPFELGCHLGARDFEADLEPARGELLESMVRAALGDYSIIFMFSRPRRPICLGPGVDRLHPYLLMNVGLDLPLLLERSGITDEPELFLRKLASLARLAVSAGVQKRNYLRDTLHEVGADRSLLQRGFLLDRARLMVVPQGLDSVVRSLTGSTFFTNKGSLELARRILQSLRDVLVEEGARRFVDTVVDTTEIIARNDAQVPVGEQLLAAGKLHALTGSGTAVAALAEDERLGVEQVVRLLDYVWRHTEVARLRLQPRPTPDQQPTLLG